MIDLLLELCLRDMPETCAPHLLPGACVEARATDWVAAHPAAVPRGWSCADPATAVAPLAVTEVAPGVFVHRGHDEMPSPENAGDEANVGFVIGRDAVAVIDAGGSRGVAEALYAAIRARTELPIGWVILTHMHPDHVIGAALFREAGAKVVGHARLPDALLNRSETYSEALVRQIGPLAALGGDIVLPDETVADRREIDLGGRVLLLEAHPTAHTDNDLTVLDTETGTWWMGDLVFQHHAPSVDGSALGWIALLDALAARPAARIVPGHGAPSLPWPEGAAATRDYLAGLVGETRAALARGESLTEAAPRIGQDLRGDWVLFDEFNTRNATAVYRELEWE